MKKSRPPPLTYPPPLPPGTQRWRTVYKNSLNQFITFYFSLHTPKNILNSIVLEKYYSKIFAICTMISNDILYVFLIILFDNEAALQLGYVHQYLSIFHLIMKINCLFYMFIYISQIKNFGSMKESEVSGFYVFSHIWMMGSFRCPARVQSSPQGLEIPVKLL